MSIEATLLENRSATGRRRVEEVPVAPRIGRYLLLERLGAGSMGAVYSAFDPELERRVAIKLLHPHRLEGAGSDGRLRLLREAQAMARLAHPHVVTVFDVGAFGEDVFIAMELISGGDLGTWLQERQRRWPEIVEVFIQAGRGLEAAHAAGLVHRDFKPENVLVDASGRVRVTDFGLARSLSEALEEADAKPPAGLFAASGESTFDENLTATGALVGTPAYMAPEVFVGQAADAATDQFSFCVALWEALYGERPFQGTTLPALTRAILQGAIHQPREAGVPPWLRQVLLRGLEGDPEARWPSMSTLLEALKDDPGRRRRWRLGAVLAALVGVAASGWHVGQSAYDVCGGAERRLEGVWDAPRQAATQASFAATGLPFAAVTWPRVERAVDAYAERWMELYERSCRAHRRGEGSARLYDLRLACLESRRAGLGGLVDALMEADMQTVRRALQAIEDLPNLEHCGDTEILLAMWPPPADAGAARRVEEMRGELARIASLVAAGRPGSAKEILVPLVSEARALGYPPLLAEVHGLQGSLAAVAYDLEGAEATLTEAWELALQVGHTEVAFEAALRLARVLGYRQARFAEADQWAPSARALARSHPDTSQVWGRYLRVMGQVANHRGASDKALDYFGQALDHELRHHGEDSLPAARSYNQLGGTYARLGRWSEAYHAFQHALRVLGDRLGRRHPDVGGQYLNLGKVYGAMGRHREEREAYLRALELFRESYGEDHVLVGRTLANLGLGMLENGGGSLVEARQSLEEAVAILRGHFGDDHVDVAQVLTGLGRVHRVAVRLPEARAVLEEAVATFERLDQVRHPRFATTLTELGRVLLEQGEPRRARDILEQALDLREEVTADPFATATTRFTLARSLWQVGERERGRRLARRALEELQAAEKVADQEIIAVASWLSVHGG